MIDHAQRADRARGRLLVSLAWGLLLAGLVTMALSLSIPSRLTSAGVTAFDRLTKPTTEATYGEPVVLAGGGQLPAIEVTAARPIRVTSLTPGQRATPGNRLVGAAVTLHNVGELAWSGGHSLVVRVVDQQGASYDVRSSVSRTNAARSLSLSASLRPGRSAHGVVVFEVPRPTRIAAVTVTVEGQRTRTGAWSARN